MASNTPALSDPVPPVLWEPFTRGANYRWRRGGERRGRRRGGRRSGWRRPFDPQNGGRAVRPKPRGGHGDDHAIGWGQRNLGRRRSLPISHIKSITCRLLQRGVPIPRHEARAQGTGWVRLRWGNRRGGVDGHGTDGLIPTLPRLTSPLLVGHANATGSEEGRHRAVSIEDFKKINKHHPLNLGSGDGGGQLNGTPHKMSMRCRREFDPVNRQAIGLLGRSDVGHQPVPRKEPVAAKEVEEVEHGGVRWERYESRGAKRQQP